MTPEQLALLARSMRAGLPPFSRRDRSRDASAQWVAYDRVFDAVCYTLVDVPEQRLELRRLVLE